MALADEKYLRLTTFKRDGTAVPTPVWSVGLPDGRVGFWTSSGSGKAKRLAHTSRVLVQPSDARGRAKPGTEPIEATAEVVTGPEYDTIYRLVKAKYGFVTHLTKAVGNLIGIVKRHRVPYGDCGIVITPAAGVTGG
jgi:uncharacterized protein